MKTREEIITSMCYTWRHDYGLDRKENSIWSSGTTEHEQRLIWQQMAQIFDNDIAPHMEFKNG